MDYSKIDKGLCRIHSVIGSVNPHPYNIEAERKKVFQNRLYNPVFKYMRNTKSSSRLKSELLQMRFDSSVIGKLLKEKAREYMLKISLIESLGTPRVTQHSISLYGSPSKELVAKASKFLAQSKYSRSEAMSYSGVGAVKKFIDVFMTKGLNWKVETRSMAVRAAINAEKRVLYLNKDRTFSDLAIKKLMIHEVGTHVMRAENGRKQHLRLFTIGFPDYLATEEGLAVYNEEAAGVLTKADIMGYAGRTVAVDLGLKNSFSTVYNALLEYFPKEEAFSLAARAKRGLSDTSKPGGFTKDYLYLKGYIDVKSYIRRGGRIDLLYKGKIGIKHVPLLKKLNGNII